MAYLQQSGHASRIMQLRCIQWCMSGIRAKLENGMITFQVSAVEAEHLGEGSDFPETARGTLSKFQIKVITPVHKLMAVR